MTHYTLGFLFNRNVSKVLLVHKLSPAWQKDKVNGLGGKFDAGETCYECIVREVKEETGLITQLSDWKKIGEIHSPRSYVEILITVYQGEETTAQTLEKEKIEWFPITQLPTNSLSNLFWLVPLCRDVIENEEIEVFIANYK